MKLFLNTSIPTFLLVFLCIINPSFATNYDWGKTGHRTIGAIAEQHLSRKAKKEISKLLNGESLAKAATFADEIKSDRKYNHFLSWHYVNIKDEATYKTSQKNSRGDLISGIDKCIKVLNSKRASEEDKTFYLKLLIHLVGDLHQPLHIGHREDRGGNDIEVLWFGKKSNLHRVWDSEMIDSYGMSYTELADNLNRTAIKDSLKNGTTLDWMEDTRTHTKDIYSSVTANENLRYSYSYKYFPIVEKQLLKGGLRLATLLNTIFK